ncbi:hypothetical protein SCLCIDRAFT_1222484 [Scleroderma citrinum Foug A]|uniref:EF-hand domain-containing protein n=1 Tax=Scleroderma citrinum Foug A TaxID=1036808 RepID=A0A0C3DBR8_9AGAM|nr:hypothetical protein SCLCIDRAFT_1222484 [Scleroderma citrinum Foug A]
MFCTRAMCEEPPLPAVALPPSLIQSNNPNQDRLEARFGLPTFRVFLSEILTWVRNEKIIFNAFQQCSDREVVEHELIDRLFFFWDTSRRGSLSFQDVVSGLDDKDGYLSKDEVLTLSECLLFIFRYEIGDTYLGASPSPDRQ